ncbi:MAG: NADase-type glycan-binding domain-containing protein, partial [Bacteroidota bacterium]
MKIVIALTILCLSSKLQAQLMTVSAEGGERVIDWTSEKNNLSEDNPFLFGSGCSVGPTKAYVSSCLAAQGNSSYKAKNLFDWDPQTAWVEGKSDYGIGEYFEVDLILGGSGISIFNGYQKSYDAWKNNSRVKKIKVYADGQPVCYVELKDLMGYQTFSLPVDYLTQYEDTLLFGKKVTSSNIRRVVKRVEWVRGKKYDMYR